MRRVTITLKLGYFTWFMQRNFIITNKRSKVMKRVFTIMLSIVLMCNLLVSFKVTNVEAKSKIQLSKKSATIYVGKTKTIKLKNVNKKVKWTVKNKKLVTISKKSGQYKNKITIKGKKAGKTTVIAKIGKKKYQCSIAVKKEQIEETTAKVIPETTTKVIPETTTKKEEPTIDSAKKDTIEMNASYDNEILTVTITNYKKEELHVGYGDGKLEKYVDGQWINGWPGGGYTAIEILRLVGLNQSISFRIGFCGKGYEGIGDTEKGLNSGHYRYSHNLEAYNKGEGWITTEFDVVESPTDIQNPYENKNIIATVKNDKITVEDDLVLIFTLQDYKEGQGMEWSYAPNKLEKYEDGEWINIPSVSGFPEPMYSVIGKEATFNMPLKDYFEFSEGHYRWTHEVNYTNVSVEFDVYG